MKFFKWIKKLLFGIESKPSTKSNKDVSKEQTNKVYSETSEVEFKEEPKLEVFYGKPVKFEPIVEPIVEAVEPIVEAVEPVVEQKKVEKAPKKAKKAKKAKKIEIPVIESDKVKKLVENNPKKKTKKPSDKK
jgi:hypothetical protein